MDLWEKFEIPGWLQCLQRILGASEQKNQLLFLNEIESWRLAAGFDQLVLLTGVLRTASEEQR